MAPTDCGELCAEAGDGGSDPFALDDDLRTTDSGRSVEGQHLIGETAEDRFGSNKQGVSPTTVR